MASSLFGNTQPTPANNFSAMLQRFGEFKRQMSGQDPQAIVQNLIASGQMSQQQYKQLSEMAQTLQGILK